MKRGDVWRVVFDPSIGSEIQKTRPAVIVSNDLANHYLNRVVVVPLTSQTDKIYPGEAKVLAGDRYAKAMADQIMAADKSRLTTKITQLSSEDMEAVDRAIRLHLQL